MKDIDKLEMALQARNYETLGVPHREVERFYLSALRRIADDEVRKSVRRLARRGG